MFHRLCIPMESVAQAMWTVAQAMWDRLHRLFGPLHRLCGVKLKMWHFCRGVATVSNLNPGCFELRLGFDNFARIITFPMLPRLCEISCTVYVVCCTGYVE